MCSAINAALSTGWTNEKPLPLCLILYSPPVAQMGKCDFPHWLALTKTLSTCFAQRTQVQSFLSFDVLTSHNISVATEFRKNIRTYNNLFAFCSVGAEFDPSVWGPSGHHIVRLHGQLYHQIGSLLPESSPGTKPRFSQTYIMDGDEDHIADTRTSYSHGRADKQTIIRLQVSFRTSSHLF